MKKIGFLIIFLLIFLNGCSFKNSTTQNTEIKKQEITNFSNIEEISNYTIKNLKNKNIENLVKIVGIKGLHISPYGNLNIQEDMILTKKEIIDYYLDNKIYKRGYYDGSGYPIELTFKDYYDKFIYDKDYLNAPEIIKNELIQRGNIINNVKEIYPNSYTIEYYFSGFDQQYEGLDRASLTLIFEKNLNTRYLIGIIHGQRTI